jgi:hypothetical protein
MSDFDIDSLAQPSTHVSIPSGGQFTDSDSDVNSRYGNTVSEPLLDKETSPTRTSRKLFDVNRETLDHWLMDLWLFVLIVAASATVCLSAMQGNIVELSIENWMGLTGALNFMSAFSFGWWMHVRVNTENNSPNSTKHMVMSRNSLRFAMFALILVISFALVVDIGYLTSEIGWTNTKDVTLDAFSSGNNVVARWETNFIVAFESWSYALGFPVLLYVLFESYHWKCSMDTTPRSLSD